MRLPYSEYDLGIGISNNTRCSQRTSGERMEGLAGGPTFTQCLAEILGEGRQIPGGQTL